MQKIFSYGGGVQSTAGLVLAAQGRIDYQTFLFCNVGNNAENPATLTYVHEVAMPYARTHGIELIELQKTWIKGERAGQKVDLYDTLIDPKSRSNGIPIRLGSGAPGNRSCTVDFKIEVADRWLRQQGAKEQGAQVALGISLDEFQRMRQGIDPKKPWKELVYPLIALRLTRQDCMNIIQKAGLPIPDKSSCISCPFHTLPFWQKMRNEQPEDFEKSCNLEDIMRERSNKLGRGDIWFTDKRKPLRMVTTAYVQKDMFEGDQICDSGYCFV